MLVYFRKRKSKLVLLLFAASIWYYFCLPKVLFADSVSKVITDSDNNLLGARIAEDEQWRFPKNEFVPELFKKAIISFEDKRFYSHFGVDPLAIIRALKLNLSQQKVVSGGSTISMQVIRLSRKGKARSISEKIVEIFLATRLEFRYSKDEILAFYASNAPFGGNIVGIDAAAWKYYGRNTSQLSLAEFTTLAVLPNAPSLIHLGKNRKLLFEKRNRLLDKMFATQLIDSLDYILAKEEALPSKAMRLPSHAPRLLNRIIKENKKLAENSIIKTTIDGNLQRQANEIVFRHHEILAQSGINNIAAMVVEVESGNVIAYVGNTPYSRGKNGYDVDIIQAPRSSGSLFKPFLYASMLSDGKLMPHALVPDIPSYYSGYTPKNFDHQYSGAIPASEALYRSLNVPTIRLLSDFGINKFHLKIRQLGITTLKKSAQHYGLSMVVGGAECSMWDVSAAYCGMARALNQFNENGGFYKTNNYHSLNILFNNSNIDLKRNEVSDGVLSAASIWQTFDALKEAERPGTEGYWRNFPSSQKVAWKTGTSFGFRDAWAVGVTPKYLVAVWCGNADGEGRPDLVGVRAAAPVMFDLFNLLENAPEWFNLPEKEMSALEICSKSGYRAKDVCESVDTILVPTTAQKTKACPFHKMIHLDENGEQRVHSECYDVSMMVHKSYFVLPPIMESYFQRRQPNYKVIPNYKMECLETLSKKEKYMQLVYPNPRSKISIPINLDETRSSTIFEVSHRSANAVIYWHLDEVYLGKTKHIHQFALNPNVGMHTLTLVDENGEVLTQKFEIF